MNPTKPPLWVRAGPIAPELGLTLPALERALTEGAIPVRRMVIGPRQLLYLHRPDLDAYRASVGAPPTNHGSPHAR